MCYTTQVIPSDLLASVSRIYAVDIAALKSGLVPGFEVEAILSDCELCLGFLKTALETDTIVLTDSDTESIALAEAVDLCLDVQSAAKERIFRTRIQQALLQATVWLDDLRQLEALDEDQIAMASESGEALLTVLNDARVAGISEWTTVALRNEQITLTEARELASFIRGAAARASSTAA